MYYEDGRVHLFEDVYEEGVVYLEISKTYFSADPDSVLVAIPADVWEKIGRPTAELRALRAKAKP